MVGKQKNLELLCKTAFPDVILVSAKGAIDGQNWAFTTGLSQPASQPLSP